MSSPKHGRFVFLREVVLEVSVLACYIVLYYERDTQGLSAIITSSLCLALHFFVGKRLQDVPCCLSADSVVLIHVGDILSV